MDKNHNFSLIHGTFTASEAAQILFGMINNKIQYHTMENFSSQERFGKDAPHSQMRIQALKNVQTSLKEILDEAQKNNLHLKIEGTIAITMVE